MLHSYNSGYSCSFYSDIMCLEHSQTIPTWCCGGRRPPLRIDAPKIRLIGVELLIKISLTCC